MRDPGRRFRIKEQMIDRGKKTEMVTRNNAWKNTWFVYFVGETSGLTGECTRCSKQIFFCTRTFRQKGMSILPHKWPRESLIHPFSLFFYPWRHGKFTLTMQREMFFGSFWLQCIWVKTEIHKSYMRMKSWSYKGQAALICCDHNFPPDILLCYFN